MAHFNLSYHSYTFFTCHVSLVNETVSQFRFISTDKHRLLFILNIKLPKRETFDLCHVLNKKQKGTIVDNQRLIFSQSGVFRLQQLASLVYRKTGVRHKLSVEEELIEMLRLSTRSQQPDIQRCCENFTMELNARQLTALKHHGINMTPPALYNQMTG